MTPINFQPLRSVVLALTLSAAASSQAIDFGPEGMFSLTGFAKAEVQRGSNHCPDCQQYPTEDKQRQWADALVPGRPYGTSNTHVTLVQPGLGAKYDLGNGFKLNALLSQRWRDNATDQPNSSVSSDRR